MASKIKNTVDIEVKERGSAKAAKGMDQVGRSQTRMGQASASTGRQFSAQASGLGGLVAAYAGAAANVFALQQAFSALQRAAQAETIVRGTKTLALEIGANGDAILRNVQKITQSQLTLEEAAQNVNIALSAGFGQEQISRLTEVSLKASRALGRNLTDAFQRVVRGAAKLEPELLDELGIFTRIDPAVEAYANKLNIATTSLTQYEKRQAFVNAVIEEGEKKFSTIDTSAPSAQKSIEQLTTTLTELAIEFGQLTSTILKPFIDFIAGNAGNALLAFGGVLTLVFGKAAQLIGGFVSNGVKGLSQFATQLKVTAEEAKKIPEFLGGSVTAFQGQVKERGGLAPAGAGGQFRQAGIAGDLASGAAAARQRFMAGDFSQREKDLKILQQIEPQLKKNSVAAKDAEFIMKEYGKATEQAGKKAKFLGVASEKLSSGLDKVTKVARGAIVVFNSLFFILGVAQLVGTIFDIDILAKIKGFFVDMSQEADNMKSGLVGAASASAGSVKTLEDSLRAVGATDDDLKNIGENLVALGRQAEETAARLSFRAAQRAAPGKVMFNPQFIAASRSAQDSILTTVQAINQLAQAEANKDEPDQQRLVLLNKLADSYERIGFSSEAVGALTRTLGISSEEVARIFEQQGEVLADGTLSFKAYGIEINSNKMALKELSKSQRETVENVTLVQKTINDANDAYDRGSATAETLSKKLGGIRVAAKELYSMMDDEEDPMAVQELYEEFLKLGEKIDDINKKVRELKELAAIGKAINTEFSGAMKALDTAVIKGMLGKDGLATPMEQAANQATFLVQQTEAGNKTFGIRKKTVAEILDLQQQGEKLNSAEVGALANRNKAIKSIAGKAIQVGIELKKQLVSQEKATALAQNNLKIQEKTVELAKLRVNLEVQRAQNTANNKLSKEGLAIEKANVSVAEALLEASKARAKAIAETNTEIQRGLDLEKQILELQNKRIVLEAQGIRDRGINQAKDKIADLQAFPNLASDETIRRAQKDLIILEFENQKAIIDEKKRLAKVEYDNALEAIRREEQVANDRQDQIVIEMGTRMEIARMEKELRANTVAQEQEKLRQDNANLEAQKGIIDKEAEIADLKFKAIEIENEARKKARDLEISSLEIQVAVVNKLAETLASNNFNDAVAELVGIGDKAGKAAMQAAAKKAPGQVSADFERLRGLSADEAMARSGALTQQRDAQGATTIGRKAALDIQIAGNEKLSTLITERAAIEERLAEIKQEKLMDELDAEFNMLEIKKVNYAAEEQILKEQLENTLTSINQEYTANEENKKSRLAALDREGDLLRQLGNDISGNLQSSLDGFFNSVAEGNGILDSAKNAFQGFMQSVVKSLQKSVTEKFIEPAIKSAFGSLFSAAGGPVHLAAGGAMRRDRVPAMLEPGEFVIRKPMAKAIGGPALHSMNSTGKGLTPNIEVVVNNQGAPKDAEANVKPQIDVNKMVVEIVTSDLRNNGPIRKSLRGNS